MFQDNSKDSPAKNSPEHESGAFSVLSIAFWPLQHYHLDPKPSTSLCQSTPELELVLYWNAFCEAGFEITIVCLFPIRISGWPKNMTKELQACNLCAWFELKVLVWKALTVSLDTSSKLLQF